MRKYLSKSVIQFADACFTFSAVDSEEDLGLGSRRQFKAGVDVKHILEFIFVVVVDKWLNGPLWINTTRQHSRGHDFGSKLTRSATAGQLWFLVAWVCLFLFVCVFVCVCVNKIARKKRSSRIFRNRLTTVHRSHHVMPVD